MREIRTILICIIGLTLMIMTYQFKFGFSILTGITFFCLVIIGIILTIWTLISDIVAYRNEKLFQNFSLTILCLAFTITIFTIEYFVQRNFNKPTLLEVFYDGNFNGTRMTFKTDGTYIFENSVIGMFDYKYGTYKIDSDLIILDKDEIDNVIESNKLRIEVNDHAKPHVIQLDSENNMIKTATIFEVTMDNR